MFSRFRCRRKDSGLDGFRQFFSVSRSAARRQRERRAVRGAPIILKETCNVYADSIYKKKLLQIQGWYFFYFVVLWMYHLRKEKSDENRNT